MRCLHVFAFWEPDFSGTGVLRHKLGFHDSFAGALVMGDLDLGRRSQFAS